MDAVGMGEILGLDLPTFVKAINDWIPHGNDPDHRDVRAKPFIHTTKDLSTPFAEKYWKVADEGSCLVEINTQMLNPNLVIDVSSSDGGTLSRKAHNFAGRDAEVLLVMRDVPKEAIALLAERHQDQDNDWEAEFQSALTLKQKTRCPSSRLS
jgi:hypothetical protein